MDARRSEHGGAGRLSRPARHRGGLGRSTRGSRHPCRSGGGEPVSWGLRADSAAAMGLCASIAYRAGGAADRRPAPPPAPKHDAATVAPVGAPTGFEVAVRLVDAMKDAQFDVPNLRAGTYAM